MADETASSNNTTSGVSASQPMIDADFGPNVHISTHPVIAHKITALRSSTTPPHTFRSILRELTYHLGYEATSTLTTKPVAISVPHPAEKKKDADSNNNNNNGGSSHDHIDYEGVKLVERIALIPILRSGQGMVDAMMELLPNAAVHHVGMYKVVGSKPVQYYNRLPRKCQADVAYVLDPIIATSATVMSVVGILKKWGVSQIHVISVIGSRSGLKSIMQAHPTVHISVGTVDDQVTDKGFVLPGVGDAGDRLFGTSVHDTGEDDDDESLLHPSRRKRSLSESQS